MHILHFIHIIQSNIKDEVPDFVPDEIPTSCGLRNTQVDKSLTSRGLRNTTVGQPLTFAILNPQAHHSLPAGGSTNPNLPRVA